jgi:hypothetical protein
LTGHVENNSRREAGEEQGGRLASLYRLPCSFRPCPDEEASYGLYGSLAMSFSLLTGGSYSDDELLSSPCIVD